MATAEEQKRAEVPKCPPGAQHLTDDSGEPLRCLPHHTDLCVRAASSGKALQEADVCCHSNRIDYYCCVGMNRQDCPDYKNVTVVIFRDQKEPFVPNTLFQAAQGPSRPGIGDQYQSLRGFAPGPHTRFGNQVPAARGGSFSAGDIARSPFVPPPERPTGPGPFPVFSPNIQLGAPAGPLLIVNPDKMGQNEEDTGDNLPVFAPEPEEEQAAPNPVKPAFVNVRFRHRNQQQSEPQANLRQQSQFALQDDAIAQEQQSDRQEFTGANQPAARPFAFAGQPPAAPLPPAPQPPGIPPHDQRNPDSILPPVDRISDPNLPQNPSQQNPDQQAQRRPPNSAFIGSSLPQSRISEPNLPPSPTVQQQNPDLSSQWRPPNSFVDRSPSPTDQRPPPDQISSGNTDEQLSRATNFENISPSARPPNPENEENKPPSPTQQAPSTGTAPLSVWKTSTNNVRSGRPPVPHPDRQPNPPNPDRRTNVVSNSNAPQTPKGTANRNGPQPRRFALFHDDATESRPAQEPANLFEGATINIGPEFVQNMKPSQFVGFSRPGFESSRRRLRRFLM